MILSAEITMYPLQEDYIPAIDKVIEKLNSYPGVEVRTVPTATILMGEYDLVMDAIRETLRWSIEECGKAVFLAKFLPNYEALDQNL